MILICHYSSFGFHNISGKLIYLDKYSVLSSVFSINRKYECPLSLHRDAVFLYL